MQKQVPKASLSKIQSAILDADNQDEVGDIHIHIAKKREKIVPINAFALCFTASLAEIMDKHNLSRPAIRLLLEILNTSKAGNLISINQNGLAARLGVSKSSISRSMQELQKTGVMLNTDVGLFLNPQVISKQGLDTIAKNYPQEVLAGIEALQTLGIEANWLPPKVKSN